MNARRSEAYTRLMNAIYALGDMLGEPDRAALRDFADIRLFAVEAGEPVVECALDRADCLLSQLVVDGRLPERAADRLARELADCGPLLPSRQPAPLLSA